MLKIFFPAGLEMRTTDTHIEYQAAYDLFKDKKHLSAEEKQSILLISRIFSLINIECESFDKQGMQFDFGQTLDFDLS
jgi:Temperature dependent protein affecting M2 dsRNA replication